MTWGFVGFGGWLLWLRGDGQWDGGLDKVEGAALVGGGVGELVDFDVGVVVADPVAGEGAQVCEQVAEAADRVAVVIVFGGGLGLGGGGAACGATGLSRCGVLGR
ncbi:hypothetical protein MLAC_24830 [Mycobacterium lacus]|uniref:Uncharacterized protein n=1 Tax=Mycobacterium lacus TaxID=169765 RepID=A0A7I7NLN0_9MYCO|nr:hypothetical protein MLAC_05340 [Mycobacterium lacus]BBX97189.1 hypothetical protein MLAC_24830 [Mycobacterium lacus]